LRARGSGIWDRASRRVMPLLYPTSRISVKSGKAMRLVEASPQVVAGAVRQFVDDPVAREEALREGTERNGPRGALPHIASRIRLQLESQFR